MRGQVTDQDTTTSSVATHSVALSGNLPDVGRLPLFPVAMLELLSFLGFVPGERVR